ncbi:hypothetical protein [Prevotella sp. MA2016]|uniref:hypothetical protein n=1 Tax=Prevotella sp. MA2016 TaxID=1408310 RepID=UPI0006840A48|nr:hypothetical protein [Prevotella sp. MA2016]
METKDNYIEQDMFDGFFDNVDDSKSSTFQDNMKLPIHRWYRYTAGFSASWVGKLIEEEKANGRKNIIDPFVGSGTVVVESGFHNVNAYGIESHPYVYKIAQAKLQWRELDKEKLISECLAVLERAKQKQVGNVEYPPLVTKCYPIDTLQKLESLKLACLEIDNEKIQNFVWFIITSILRSVSPVGTAQWQYVLPNKTKSKVLDPYDAYLQKVRDIEHDIDSSEKKVGKESELAIFQEDARNISSIPKGWGDLVITSPPYANNYDYADALRLEMCFWNDIKGWKDLQSKVRVNLIRACTQHVGGQKAEIRNILDSEILSPIADELKEKYELLDKEKENHGGKKNYHLMITAYFYDMANVFHSLYEVTSDKCKMCFVIGDSAPYGIYIPVDEWLGKLAVSAGFKDYTFEKLRDRNVKWKNRKHRVPLKEGRLWINK